MPYNVAALWARASGKNYNPTLLPPPYEIIAYDGQSLAQGPTGSIDEKRTQNMMDRLGVGMVRNLKNTLGTVMWTQGPFTGTLDTAVPGTGLGAAVTVGSLTPGHYLAVALRRRRELAGLPNPSMIFMFCGISGQPIEEFTADPATGVYGDLIHRNRGYWMSEVKRIQPKAMMRYACFSQGEADSDDDAGLYAPIARTMWHDWLAQIQAVTSSLAMPVVTQIGGYADSLTPPKNYDVCLEQVQVAEEYGGLVPGSWYPFPVGDLNVHPDATQTMLMADTVAWAIVEHELGHSWKAFKPTSVVRSGAQLVLTYPLAPGESLVLSNSTKYDAYGGIAFGGTANKGFEAGTISAISVSGNKLYLTTASDTWAYAMQVADMTPYAVGGLNYVAHRGLLRSTRQTPSVLVPGETLYNWALSWRGGLY